MLHRAARDRLCGIGVPGAPAVLLAVLLMAGGVPSALAGDIVRDDLSFVSEIRIGALYHEDSRLKRLFGDDEPREGSVLDVTAEILFREPQWHFENDLLDILLTPRFRIGGTLNPGGGTSHVSAGLAWDAYLTRTIFAEATFDLAVHDGNVDGDEAEPGERKLGCRALFRQSFAFGKDFGEHWRILAMVEHLDNFGLCDENAGLTNIGAKLGYRF